MKYVSTRIFPLVLVIAYLCLFSPGLLAYTECTRPVNKVWTNFVHDAVLIGFSDGGSAISMPYTADTEFRQGRFYAMGLAAKTTGNSLRVRYSQDDLSCPPTGSTLTDFQGMWLVD